MWAKLLLIFFAFSFIFRIDSSFNQDLGRHLKLGEIIWQTRSIPKTNLFSYTNPDAPFINTHWLFEVFVYLASINLGLQFLLVLKIIILLLSLYLVFKTIPRENSLLLLLLGFIFLHTMRERVELRPEIFSFLFTAATYYILEKHYQAKTRLIFWLPLISLTWVNTHIYFFVGLMLQAVFLLCRYQRLNLLIFLASLLTSLVNPFGVAGLLYPISVTKNYGYTIAENQTMFLLESIGFSDPNFLFVKISLAVAGFAIAFALIKREFELKNLLIASFGMALALLNVRSFPYLVLLVLPATLQNLGQTKRQNLAKAAAVLCAVLLIYESCLYLNNSYYLNTNSNSRAELKFIENARAALDFVISHNLPNPIYNNFDIGSYIIYRGYPGYKIYIDGRPEAYPFKFFSEEYIPTQYDYAKFKNLQKQYGFKTIIFSHTDQTPWGKAFLAGVTKDPDWKTVYIDDFMIVLVLSESNLEVVDLAKLDSGNFQFATPRSYLNVAAFLANTGNATAAATFENAFWTLKRNSR